MIAFIVGIAIAVAVFAIIIAFKKHKTLTGIKESVLREVQFLEVIANKVDVTAKADYHGTIDRVKKLFS
jgi:hypothetical protein